MVGGFAKEMKRFYRDVSVAEADGGFSISLDSRAVKTPGKRALVVPFRSLAEAIAAEWAAQEEVVRPALMPMTRLANSTIDVVVHRREDIAAESARYAATDLLCYRAEGPSELVRRQQEGWQPLLDWLDERYGVRLEVTRSILPLDQSAEALDAVRSVLQALSDFALAGVHSATAAAGSVVIGLALADRRLDAEAAFQLSQLDETFQIEQWGEDAEATRRRQALQEDLTAAAGFLAHCKG